jgi:hypothetical protein
MEIKHKTNHNNNNNNIPNNNNNHKSIIPSSTPRIAHFQKLSTDTLIKLGQVFAYKQVAKALLFDYLPNVAWPVYCTFTCS